MKPKPSLGAELCSNFPAVVWDSRNREETSLVVPEAPGKRARTWGEAGLALSASSSLGLQGPRAPRQSLLSTPTPGSTHSQPQTDLSWPDPAKQFGKRVESHYFLTMAPKERKKGTKKKSGVSCSSPLQPPASPPDSSCRPKITKPFRSKPRETKRKAKEREEAAANFKGRANLCSQTAAFA